MQEKKGKNVEDNSKSSVQKVNYLQIPIDQDKTQIIIDESITSNHYNSQIDMVSYLGNILSEFTSFALFEYDNSQPLNHQCIYIQQSFEQSVSVDNVLKKQYPRSVYLKFFTCEKSKQNIQKEIEQAQKVINYIKENLDCSIEDDDDFIYYNTIDWIKKNNIM